jgi:hypothetical protein
MATQFLPLFPPQPPFTPLRSPQRRPQAPHPKSKFLAAASQRWQIELFFKWIKQNLKIKCFLGRSENAVMIQVLVALISYLLLKLVQLNGYCQLSLQKIAGLIGINLTSRRPVLALFQPDPGRKLKASKDDQPLQFGLSYA